MKPYSMISITLCSLLLLTLPLHLAGAQVTAPETCKAAIKVVSNIDYKFCVSTLNENRTFVFLDANDTRVFANISATAATTHAHNVITSIQDSLRKSPEPVTKSVLMHCTGSYNNVASSWGKAVIAINEKNDDVAKISLREGMTSVISCETQFGTAGKLSPLTGMNVVSAELVTLTYAILEVAEKNKY
ncbi:Plant invertase/pectin methylesterase inhibitor protein [Dioscorea alata]|uniref:Plant invertase/pectin methylesterase inhibitor protein n=1 Tax=Dioscorea alata TaxID=55571 RepID=A0ACB7UG05_DIOAL|nr:Plant invertase/pectin methylesterase inhibitor protein [Dioscorea alata]